MEKKSVLAFLADSSGCGHYRIIQPFSKLMLDYEVNISSFMTPESLKVDLMILQRQSNATCFYNMKYAQENYKTKVVYEIDDDLFTIDKTNYAAYKAYMLDKNVRLNIRDFFKNVDYISTSTEYLKYKISQETDKPILVFKNCIDFLIWEEHYKKRLNYYKNKTDNKIIIGWAGSSSHIIDFKEVVDALVDTISENKNVYFKSVGEDYTKYEDFKHVKDKCIHEEWKEVNEFGENLTDFDIGLIPLADTEFNKSKSNLKFIEYGSLAIPAVASDVLPYSEINPGFTGLKIKNKYKEWRKWLQKLIDNRNLRENIGNNARDYVKKNYDLDKEVVRRKNWMDSILC